jgi:polar amino acid transport system permease protein
LYYFRTKEDFFVSAEYIADLMPQLMQGLKITVQLFVVTLVVSLPLGLVISLLREAAETPKSKNLLVIVVTFIVKWAIKLYLLVFRGTPLMLQLFFVYFGLPNVILPGGGTIVLDMFPAAAVAFILNYAAYFAEIFRGGIIGVSKGQYEASKALGFNMSQTMRLIVVPQMLRTVIPPIANETIILVKDTALASSIALIDLLRVAQRAVNRDMNVAAYLIAAVIYLIITLVLTYIFHRIEKRLAISQVQNPAG